MVADIVPPKDSLAEINEGELTEMSSVIKSKARETLPFVTAAIKELEHSEIIGAKKETYERLKKWQTVLSDWSKPKKLVKAKIHAKKLQRLYYFCIFEME